MAEKICRSIAFLTNNPTEKKVTKELCRHDTFHKLSEEIEPNERYVFKFILEEEEEPEIPFAGTHRYMKGKLAYCRLEGGVVAIIGEDNFPMTILSQ